MSLNFTSFLASVSVASVLSFASAAFICIDITAATAAQINLLFIKTLILYFFNSLILNSTTFSTCGVCGNISTGCTLSTLYRGSSNCRSRAWVAGLQLTYTMRLGAAFIITFTTSGCIPARGGSVIITSGLPCSAMKSSVSMSFMSPAKNDVLYMPLISEFTFASSIASGTYSMPTTLLALRATKLAIVPVPVYRSYTVSLPVSWAKSRATQ